jgi:hypothetical protein
MGYEVIGLQNTSNYSGEVPTIHIGKESPSWDEAYENWCQGKPPTDSQEWKKGVIAVTAEIKKSFWQGIKEAWRETGEFMEEKREQREAYFKKVEEGWDRYHEVRNDPNYRVAADDKDKGLPWFFAIMAIVIFYGVIQYAVMNLF